MAVTVKKVVKDEKPKQLNYDDVKIVEFGESKEKTQRLETIEQIILNNLKKY